MANRTGRIAALGAGALLSVLATNCSIEPGSVAKSLIEPLFDYSKTQIIETEIVDVQRSSVAFICWATGYGGYGNTYITANHEFEYVITRDDEGRFHTFIYPRSSVIPKGDVRIRIVQRYGLSITSSEFIDEFLNKNPLRPVGLSDYKTADEFEIRVDGVILEINSPYMSTVIP